MFDFNGLLSTVLGLIEDFFTSFLKSTIVGFINDLFGIDEDDDDGILA